MASASSAQDLLNRIRALPADKIAEVADFVELLALEAKEQRAAASVAPSGGGLLRTLPTM